MIQFLKKNLTVFICLILISVFGFYHYQNKWTGQTKTKEDLSFNGLVFDSKTTSKIKPVFTETIGADVSLIGNIETGQIIYENNIDKESLIASITKLMSASIVLNKMDLDEIIIIDNGIYSKLPDKNDLLLNEKIKVYDLLRMALVMSSNDSITALAYSYGYDDFVSLMNQKALELGMFHSHFDNPVGFDSPQNYSTALDLFYLSRYIYNNHPLLGEISKSKAFNIKSASNITHLVIPTNTIISEIKEFWAGKTGLTPEASGALLTIYEFKNSQNKNIPFVSIVLKTKDRFKDTKIIYEWLKENKPLLINY